MNKDEFIIQIFGKENLQYYSKQIEILKNKDDTLNDLIDLRQRMHDIFKVHLTFSDIAVSAASGILMGLSNTLFKNYIHIKSINQGNKITFNNTFGSFNHEHEVSRTIIDAAPPKIQGMSLDLHRQLGPQHDIFRIKETLDLIRGNKNDYDIWGSTATKIIGHELTPIGMKYTQFIETCGFKIPNEPKRELFNHLLIDFFTKRSIPIPGSTYIADNSKKIAPIMLLIYDKGLNFKTLMGNSLGFIIIQMVIRSYTFLFKAIPESDFRLNNISKDSLKKLLDTYSILIKKNEFHIMMSIAHGASFLIDSIITISTKNYAGLFNLNYLSLLAFSKHLFQYFANDIKKYKKLINESKEKSKNLSEYNLFWENDFKMAFYNNFYDPNFLSIFNEDEWLKDEEIIENFRNEIESNLKKENLIFKQLKNNL